MVKVENYELREDLYYWAKGLTWAKKEPDGRIRVGMTDLAQALAQKIRFTRIKPKGMVIEQGKGIANVESQKWVGQVQSPVTGTVDEANPALRTKASLINDDPYSEGWVAIVKPSKPEELDCLIHGAAAVEWYKKEIETRIKK